MESHLKLSPHWFKIISEESSNFSQLLLNNIVTAERISMKIGIDIVYYLADSQLTFHYFKLCLFCQTNKYFSRTQRCITVTLVA